MYQPARDSSFNFFKAGWLVCFVVLLPAASGVAQQPETNGQANSPKKTAAAWRLQAASLAGKLDLEQAKAESLIETYVAARKSRRKTIKGLRQTEADEDARKKKTEEINAREREKLSIAIRKFLSPEQAEEAMLSLGSFNPRWDRYVMHIEAFELDQAKQEESLRLTLNYIVDYQKARTAAQAAESRLSSVVARGLKTSLDEGLAKLLSAEQLSTWNTATAFRGRNASSTDPAVRKPLGQRKPPNAGRGG